MAKDDLQLEVERALRRRKHQWGEIAKIPGISYSWVYQLATGRYNSSATYHRLKAVSDWLRQHP